PAGTTAAPGASLVFTVTFSEAVTGVNASAFVPATTGGITGAAVASVEPVSGSIYRVTVHSGSGAGTLRLDVADGAALHDQAGNPLAAGFRGGPAVTLALAKVPTTLAAHGGSAHLPIKVTAAGTVKVTLHTGQGTFQVKGKGVHGSGTGTVTL